MKNTYKLLTLVLAIPLLTGCGKVKEPKFAAKGNKVEAGVFDDAYADSIANTCYAADAFCSSKLTTSAKSHVKNELKRNNKTMVRIIEDGKSSSEYLYDADNHVAIHKTKSNNTTYQYGTSESGIARTKEDEERYYQGYTSEDNHYVINVNVNDKSFTKYKKLVDESDLVDAMDLLARSTADSYFAPDLGNMLRDYDLGTEEERAKYGFYVNSDKSVTFEYESAVTDEEIKDYADNVYAQRSQTVYKKAQVQFDGNNLKSLYYSSTSTTMKYVADYNNYVKGDIVTEEEGIAKENKIEKSDNTLNPISVVDFTKYGTSW